MAVETNITDSATGKYAEVDYTDGEKKALVVANRDLKTYTSGVKFFEDSTYGYDMNIGAAVGATPINIHDGKDNAYWTATIVSGVWDFDSTAQFYDTAQSIDGTETLNDDVATFDKGSAQTTDGYSSVSGYVYITGWSAVGVKQVNIYGYSTDTIIGNSANIGDYVDIGNLNVWQKFIIPLENMGLVDQTINSFRVQTVNTGGGVTPNYYLDLIKLELESTVGGIFKIKPDKGTWFHVEKIRTTLGATSYVATTADNMSVPPLDYQTILNVASLDGGIIYQRTQGGVPQLTNQVRMIRDYLTFPQTEIKNVIWKNGNILVTIETEYATPETLKPENEDEITMSVQENVSSLSYYRMSALGRIEDRTQTC